ncbi:MAG TPA: hypothetical protein VGX91_10065 [Candidatus Cybelea sp.]|jgi:hypothetical protein|nr:hypothetical protein [Candidatus Cybelea sp.]
MFILREGSLLRPLLSAAFAAAAMAVSACSGNSLTPAAPSGAAMPLGAAAAESFEFVTLDDESDPTFNQLLGINNKGKIAGYFGMGIPGHPNKGYTLLAPYGQGNYVNENFPGSAQTQVTAINNHGDTAGFWVNNKNLNFGFIEWNGVFTSYKDPETRNGKVNQILGVNDSGTAVGFYVDAKGNSHGFTLDQATGKFQAVKPPGGGVSVSVTAINDAGDLTGFFTTASKQTYAFLRKGNHFSTFGFPGGSNTQPLGINSGDQIVGSYDDGAGVMHGFLLSRPLSHAKWQSIDDPNGIGSTVVNGLNDRGEMVGFYTDAAGNTDGMLVVTQP